MPHAVTVVLVSPVVAFVMLRGLRPTPARLRMKPWRAIVAVVAAAACGVPTDESEFQAFHSGDASSAEAADYRSARLAYLTALAEYERGPAKSRLRQMDAKSPDVAALARCEAAGEEYGLARTLAEAAERVRSEARELRDTAPPAEQLEAAEAAVREAAAALGMAEDDLRTAEIAVQRWEERRPERQKRERELEAATNRLAELERELEPHLNLSWRSSMAESAHYRVDLAKEAVRQAEARLAEEPSPYEADLSGLRKTVDTAREFLLEKEGIWLEVERLRAAKRREIRERWRTINEDAEELVRHASYRRDVADAALRRAITEAMEQRRPGGQICSWRLE